MAAADTILSRLKSEECFGDYLGKSNDSTLEGAEQALPLSSNEQTWLT